MCCASERVRLNWVRTKEQRCELVDIVIAEAMIPIITTTMCAATIFSNDIMMAGTYANCNIQVILFCC